MAEKSHGMVQEIRALRESEDFDLANYDTAQVPPSLDTPPFSITDRRATATRETPNLLLGHHNIHLDEASPDKVRRRCLGDSRRLGFETPVGRVQCVRTRPTVHEHTRTWEPPVRDTRIRLGAPRCVKSISRTRPPSQEPILGAAAAKSLQRGSHALVGVRGAAPGRCSWLTPIIIRHSSHRWVAGWRARWPR